MRPVIQEPGVAADSLRMTTLRLWLSRTARPALMAGAFLVFASLSPLAAAPDPATASVNPLARLKAGNDRYVKGTMTPVNTGAVARQALAGDQHPLAMVLSCADSRVPPEFVFNAGLGDLLVVRTAGAVVDKAVIATLEHGSEGLRIPLLVVMGHESCDVVRTAVESSPVEGPNLDYVTRAIRAGAMRTTAEQKDLRAAILANVEQVINDAMAGSLILRQAAATGRLQVVGAYHDLGSGAVVFSEPVGAAATTASAHK